MDEPPYFLSLPLFPGHAFGDEQIDGLVPACRVESWEKFIDAMRSPGHNTAKGEIIYRGQAGHNWHLSSTLGRLFDGGSVPPEHETNLLHEFRLAMRGRGLDLSNIADDREVWALGQHHGLCTPLIDWTKSPYVALFFAFDEMDAESVPNPSRAVFCLNMTAIRETLPEIIFEPTHHENARLVNQAGLFTITPSGGDNLVSAIINGLADNEVIDPSNPQDVARFISKIHIPNENRVDCLNTLRKMNIHHANLFPDPGGASRYCNDWLVRVIDEERRNSVRLSASAAMETKIQATLHVEQGSEIIPNYQDMNDLIEVLFASYDGISQGDRAIISDKLVKAYQAEAGVDWPSRPNSVLQLKLMFRRILLSFGVDRKMAEACDHRIVEYFKARWRPNDQAQIAPQA